MPTNILKYKVDTTGIQNFFLLLYVNIVTQKVIVAVYFFFIREVKNSSIIHVIVQ